jgi:hypothetical protein
MNKEDIIRMAREAGLTVCRDEWVFGEMLERFASLVYARGFAAGMKNEEQITREEVAAERAAILQMSRDQWFKTQAEFEAAIQARSNP